MGSKVRKEGGRVECVREELHGPLIQFSSWLGGWGEGEPSLSCGMLHTMQHNEGAGGPAHCHSSLQKNCTMKTLGPATQTV